MQILIAIMGEKYPGKVYELFILSCKEKRIDYIKMFLNHRVYGYYYYYKLDDPFTLECWNTCLNIVKDDQEILNLLQQHKTKKFDFWNQNSINYCSKI